MDELLVINLPKYILQTSTSDIVVKSEIKMKNIPNAQLIMWTIEFTIISRKSPGISDGVSFFNELKFEQDFNLSTISYI